MSGAVLQTRQLLPQTWPRLSLWPPHNTGQKQPREALDRLNRKGTGGE